MRNKIRYCVLCNRYDRISRSRYTRISTAEREAKLLEGYRRRYVDKQLPSPMLNRMVHQKCYNKIVQDVVAPNESIVMITNNCPSADEEDHREQTSVIQCRTQMSVPSKINKRLLERRQHTCVLCHRYGYRAHNKLIQIVSNFTANNLAEGFTHIYKKPIDRPLLDAYLHRLCFRKLYSSYRYHALKRNQIEEFKQRQDEIVYSPHDTRSRSNLNQSFGLTSLPNTTSGETASSNSIDELFSMPFSTSAITTDPNIELSARSSLFRPCLTRLTSEEIELYTSRTSINKSINEQNRLTGNRSIIYSNRESNDNDVSNLHEKDRSSDWMVNQSISSALQSKTSTQVFSIAKIRRRTPESNILSDHTYTQQYHSSIPDDYEKLYNWLTEQFDTIDYPISMGEVVRKYREFTENTIIHRESICRDRLRTRLEKYYPNRFIFVTPNKREGTFIALNNIEHYIRLAIKNSKHERQKAMEVSILTPAPVLPVPTDYKRQTCETMMNAARKLRLYIRDPKQSNVNPPLIVRNFLSLLTTTEKQFEKISQHYDFYRMVDDDLFGNGENTAVDRLEKTRRITNLALDLINTRHDNRISEKQYQLADELNKLGADCTPKRVITLLSHYGYTCAYKSYLKLKASKQKSINLIHEEIIDDFHKIIQMDEKSTDYE